MSTWGASGRPRIGTMINFGEIIRKRTVLARRTDGGAGGKRTGAAAFRGGGKACQGHVCGARRQAELVARGCVQVGGKLTCTCETPKQHTRTAQRCGRTTNITPELLLATAWMRHISPCGLFFDSVAWIGARNLGLRGSSSICVIVVLCKRMCIQMVLNRLLWVSACVRLSGPCPNVVRLSCNLEMPT